jgi:hypothetical protein
MTRFDWITRLEANLVGFLDHLQYAHPPPRLKEDCLVATQILPGKLRLFVSPGTQSMAKFMKSTFRSISDCLMTAAVSLLLSSSSAWAGTFTIDFDNLPGLGSTVGSQSFADANGGSDTTQGVTFGSNFRVVGDQYRVGGATPNPAFGVPHSGHFFLANGNTPNNDLMITTTSVLLEAWFGRNEYYGYGGGATSVSVTAVGASGDLGTVSLNLPDTFPYTGNLPDPNSGIGNGLPDPMVKLDTSSFQGLSGITGYRISRVDANVTNGNWVADDFKFTTPSTVPEPGSLVSLAIGLTGVALMRRRLV